MHVIAIVDDEECVRRSMERLLRMSGYDVASFAGGAEFLDWLKGARPACVLVDRNMPGMDGREVLSRLPAGIPAILVSGHATAADRDVAGRCGAVAFFEKPFDPAQLLTTIAAVIAAPGRRPEP
jgi:two-component system, LuxR family, response regulator FixJ